MNTIYLKSSDPDVVAYVQEQDRLFAEFVAQVKAFDDTHEGLTAAVLQNPFNGEMFVGGVHTKHPELLPGKWKKPNHYNGSLQPYRNNREGRKLIAGMHFKAPDYPGVCTQTFYAERCLVTTAFAHDGSAWALCGAKSDNGEPRYDPDKWAECLHWEYEKAAHDARELRRNPA